MATPPATAEVESVSQVSVGNVAESLANTSLETYEPTTLCSYPIEAVFDLP